MSEPAPDVVWSALLKEALHGVEASWQQWLLAGARILPLVMIVPAFGSRLMPAPARFVLGLGLAATLLPTLAQQSFTSAAWGVAVARELLQGLPIALSSGALIWGATMAGGLADDLRGASPQLPGLLSADTPLATLLGLFATCGFLKLGGVDSAMSSLVNSGEPPTTWILARAVRDLVNSLHIAFAVCAPVLCASVVTEIAMGLMARAAAPASVRAMLAPLRALTVLGTFTLALPALIELLMRIFATQLLGNRTVP